MSDLAAKPPAQTLGVGGIQEVPIVMHQPVNPGSIALIQLVKLPPFQMFAIEKQYASAEGIDTACLPDPNAALPVINELLRRAGGDAEALISEYILWHEAKGYWPEETPLGKLSAEVNDGFCN